MILLIVHLYLLRILLSDNKRECDNYDYTTTGETTEETRKIVQSKRKPKKKTFSDYILGNIYTCIFFLPILTIVLIAFDNLQFQIEIFLLYEIYDKVL